MARNVVYRIDLSDRITHVGRFRRWFSFSGDTSHPVAQRVIGQVLWGYIKDDATRALYKQAAERARAGRAASFRVTCDIAGPKRALKVKVFALKTGEVEFRIKLVHSKRFMAPFFWLLRACSWCKKVAVGEKDWKGADAAVRELHLLDRHLLPGFTHGICPTCLQQVMADLKNKPVFSGPPRAA